MPADPFTRQLAGPARFRADLAAYLDSLPIGELAELLGELPSARQQPLGLGVLMVALNERLPDVYKLLPPVGHPSPGEGRRRSLREVVADRLAAQHTGPPPSGLAECWLTASSRPTCTPSGPGRARLASGGWRRRCAAEPVIPTRPPTARSTATHRPSGSATGRTRSPTATSRTTSATAGAPTGSEPGSASWCRSGVGSS